MMKMKRGLLTIVVIGFENEKLRSSISQQYQWMMMKFFFGFVWDLKPESFPLIWFNGMWNEKGGKILTTSDWIAQKGMLV